MKGLMTAVLSIGLVVSSAAIARAEDSSNRDRTNARFLTTEPVTADNRQTDRPTIDLEQVAESLEINQDNTPLILSDLDNRPEESNNFEVVF